MTLEPNTPLQDERFLFLEALGRGGMGAVYRAFDRAEQRLVALKVPSDPARSGPAHPLSIEFDVWSRLRHPHVVKVYELALAESGPLAVGTPYLVLEHVDGGPLHRVLRPGRVTSSTAEALAGQLLTALAHVHASGFVHRDLKPGNVLVERTADGKPSLKLTDFGLAARIGAHRRAGVLSGSIPYVSPEALLGLPLDGRADLYSLGVLLYHLTTGQMPMPSGVPREILRWHLSGPPADPAQVRNKLSARLARFIRRLTTRDREERPSSALSALNLLGSRTGVGNNRAVPPLSGRAARLGLRLALDAVRLGARRVYRLPASSAAEAEMLRDVAVSAQVRGVKCYGLSDDPSRLVLRLVVERGAAGAMLVRRYGLHRSLSLDLLGGAPLRDPLRVAASGPDDRKTLRESARGICGFLLSCAEFRPMVLCVERAAVRVPLAREVTRLLIEAVCSSPNTPGGRGGLLLLVGVRPRCSAMASTSEAAGSIR